MKTVVITGASRGIGLATAKKFLEHGWQVIGTYLHTPMPFAHEHLISVRYDQEDPTSIAQAAAEIKRVTQRIDVLVNNAGAIFDAHDTTIDMARIRKTFEIDLFGVMDFTELLLPAIPAGGHIVNIDSNYGSFSFPIDDRTSTGYRLAKASLNMYTRTLAFRQPHLVVSALDPGWVKTDMGLDGATEEEGPNREPEQAAQEIYLLATSQAESGQFWQFGKKRQW